jgi:hypothetical protein
MGLSGLDVWPWLARNESSCVVQLYFEQSRIDFYINGTRASDMPCSPDLIPSATRTSSSSSSSSSSTLFSSFQNIGFYWQNSYSEQPVCPFLFTNAVVSTLLVYNQIDAILVSNLFRFMCGEEKEIGQGTSINSNITQLQVQGYGFRLDTGLAHPLVFEQITEIQIYRSIGSIQDNLFENFKQLKDVYLILENFKNFYHSSLGGIASWTRSMPNKSSILVQTYIETYASWFQSTIYTYPDTDFCLFARFPIHRGMFAIFFDSLVNCTSTIRWLSFNFMKDSICANSSFWNETLARDPLYFEKKISQCEHTNLSRKTKLHAEYYQVEFILEFIQDLIIFIAIPCACLLGLFLNYLIVWTVNKNKEKELKDSFYQYMSLNAKFNCAYCLIFLFYPVNSCVNRLTTSGLFCSAIRASYLTQLYKIIFIAFFGETIKMCANIFYILISVNRYMLIGREGHNQTFARISKWEMKWVIGVSLAFSSAFNIGHAFQYKLNNGRDFYNNLVKLEYGFAYYYAYDTYPSIDKSQSSSSLPLSIYLFVYFLINFVLFFLVNTFVELVLLVKLHRELKDKRKRLQGMKNKTNNTDNSESSQNTRRVDLLMSFRKRRKLNIEETAEQRAITMVCVNASINFFLRLPELLFVFSLCYELFSWSFFNSFPNLPEFATDLAYLFYILTFTSNFLVYYLFNHKFKQTFANWTHAKAHS